MYAVGAVPSRTERSGRGACGRRNCLASTKYLWACRAARSGESGRSAPPRRPQIQIDAQGYLRRARRQRSKFRAERRAWVSLGRRGLTLEYFGGLDALFAGPLSLFAKWLCLNGKIREGRTTLPGDPLPPPKRDGQAFAESAASAVDVAHRGRRCCANSQPRCNGVQYALVAPGNLFPADWRERVLCPAATLCEAARGHLKRSQAVNASSDISLIVAGASPDFAHRCGTKGKFAVLQ